jgi:hypothetical protein
VFAAAFAASVASGSDRGPDAIESATTAVATAAVPRRPALDPRLPERVAATLTRGLPVVEERLRKYESCRALFARLGSDGAAALGRASYHPASAEQERRDCGPGVFALTTVGGSAIALCRRFARLSGEQAAIILLHEALHVAGQAEYPSAPGAPDSTAITGMVMTGCRLF